MIRRGQFTIDFEHLWQEGMKDWHGILPKRMVDDTLEEDFWAQSVKRKKMGQTDAYATVIFEQLKKEIDPTDCVLEIGPGWGNYTFPLAMHVEHVTCVDSSQAVLDYLKSCFREKGLGNVSYIHAKWEHYHEAKKHDVVIGVNCFYRMLEIKDALRHMNNNAKKRAIIGMTSGPIQPHYEVLHEKFGYDIKFPRRDYIDLLNILYDLGVYADCKIIPLERAYRYESLDALVEAQSKKILNSNFERSHVEEALLDFVVYKDGHYYYRHDFYAALISWTPMKQL